MERILQFQKEQDLRFGEAGMQLGLLTEQDILYALSLQFDYPYLSGPGRPVSDEVVVAYRPFSAEGERLRSLRSQLQLRWFDEAGKRTALAIVGTRRGEGRSHLAANLAVTFAQAGERTLLIDGDLRTPRQHKLFKIENQMGLSNLLVGPHAGPGGQVRGWHPGPGRAAVRAAAAQPRGAAEPADVRPHPRAEHVHVRRGADRHAGDGDRHRRHAAGALRGRHRWRWRAPTSPALAEFHDLIEYLSGCDVKVVGSVLVDVPLRKPGKAVKG